MNRDEWNDTVKFIRCSKSITRTINIHSNLRPWHFCVVEIAIGDVKGVFLISGNIHMLNLMTVFAVLDYSISEK